MNSRSIAPLNPALDRNAFMGKKPNRVVPVPPEFRRPTRISERDSISNNVKTKTGCIVIPHWNYQKGQDEGIIYQFDFFGTGAGLESAVRHIQQWISRACGKSKESSAWAKTPAFNANKWYYEQVEEMEHERKQAFKGPPPKSHECEFPLYKVSFSALPCSFFCSSHKPRRLYLGRPSLTTETSRLEVFSTTNWRLWTPSEHVTKYTSLS